MHRMYEVGKKGNTVIENIFWKGTEVMEKQKISSLLAENRETMLQLLPIQESFDLLQRDIKIGGRDASFYFLDGMTKDEAMVKIMAALFAIQEQDMPANATAFVQQCMPYIEVDVIGEFDSVIRNVLSGVTVFFIDQYEAAANYDELLERANINDFRKDSNR